ncbi:hypothetical protein [Polynucleobacter sp.]|uniref:hypothetical protein n=1 Tax=Polynucleobacter sp. TaxID=2029855 RepID=UPI003F69B10C
MADETPKTTESTVKEIDVKGYKFNVDTDLLDDVDSLEYIERIESQGQTAVVLSLLKHIMGAESFAKLKAHFVAEDGKAHEGQEGYKARMRIEVLSDVYLAIIEKFDPKG